ncbi:spore germination protein [Bacillus sp. HMF5848]|uniref:spore germination protein n=1 Tax=Bacillus sp. HMF5848 TaxID=2495421 RepID=UPI000F780F1A|nr:spore germination protein [Bacillus sp. HMF5848]RSK29372.1 spore germination protein [Bacillus sp. HMF5848]
MKLFKRFKNIQSIVQPLIENKLLSKSLKENTDAFNSKFESDINKDFIVRSFTIKALQRDATTFCLNGIVDPKASEEFILKPLQTQEFDGTQNLENDMLNMLPIKKIRTVTSFAECVLGITNGQTLLLIDGYSIGFILDTTKIEHRSIDTPQNELVIKGTNEGFVESVSINKSLIRKQLRYEKLITEEVLLKNKASNTISLMYISELVNQDVVNNVKQRLNSIEVDAIQNIALLEQYLEERPHSLVPTILYTERPDRAVSYMLEGHVVILAENSPACLVAPVTFWSFFHTAEDSYQRWAYGNFIRAIRILAFFIAIVTPAFYIAATTYHIEMLPTDLALAIAAKRETVPFPAVIEVLMMEIAFELLREAGVRVPSPIGPTIGIVGALILGQAAVEANIISPIMVIVVAVTGLASFAVPDISFSYMVRMIRFAFFIFAAMFGLFGIVICLTLSIAYLSCLTSFGVPFLSPKAPHNTSSSDLIFRKTVRKQWYRPTNITRQDTYRNDSSGGQ